MSRWEAREAQEAEEGEQRPLWAVLTLPVAFVVVLEIGVLVLFRQIDPLWLGLAIGAVGIGASVRLWRSR